MRIIAFTNQKGGVGKTTSVLNIGAGLALIGKRVMMIDLDPQGNLTEGCGFEPDKASKSIYDVLVGGTPLLDVIVPVCERLDLAVANIDLSGAEAELLKFPGKDFRLKNAVKLVKGYDYILIDCPPSLCQLTLNALTAAEEVFIPIQTHYFALKGLQKLLLTVEMVNKLLNKRLEVTGVIATMYSHRKTLHRDIVEQLRQHFGDKLFATMIRDNISLAEAPSAGQHIYDYKINCYGAEDYAALSQEIIKQEVYV